MQRCQTERRHTQALEAAAAQGAWLQQGDRVDTAALSAALRYTGVMRATRTSFSTSSTCKSQSLQQITHFGIFGHRVSRQSWEHNILYPSDLLTAPYWFDCLPFPRSAAGSFGMKLAPGKKAHAWAAFILRVRTALAPALAAPKERALWKVVDAVLSSGGNADADAASSSSSSSSLGEWMRDSAEVQAVAAEVALRSDMDEINTKIVAAVGARDEDGMRHGLDQVRSRAGIERDRHWMTHSAERVFIIIMYST